MKYVVAVSGGVDSVVLLDMLATGRLNLAGEDNRRAELIVAHVDHGIRTNSSADAAFTRQLAVGYGLSYESMELHLGAKCSEARARLERYRWLRDIQARHGAAAIILAHHQDDVIETMLINMTRGTGWRGLAALRQHPETLRPLLDRSRAEIIGYAIANRLAWVEDETNDDLRYTRNYIRHMVVARLDIAARRALVTIYQKQCQLLSQIDTESEFIAGAAWTRGGGLSSYFMIMAGQGVGAEIIMHWLGRRLGQQQLGRIQLFIATARVGARLEVEKGLSLELRRDQGGLEVRYLLG